MSSHSIPVSGEIFNYAAHLFNHNSERSDKVAYIDDQGVLSYGGLEDRSRRMASALLDAGVRMQCSYQAITNCTARSAPKYVRSSIATHRWLSRCHSMRLFST